MNDASSQPVTVLAHHTVRPGDEAAFQRWMQGISAASRRFPGYLGTEVIRPCEPGENVFVSIFRFDTYPHLDAWIGSEERKAWLEQTHQFTDEAPRLNYHSLEFLFSPEEHQGRAPTKWKMALATFCVIWPLVHFVPRAIQGAFAGPPLALEALSVGTIVLLMTYAVMPTVTRTFARWLF